MPYTCTSCGRYQQGHSADGICPASECQPARQAKAAQQVTVPFRHASEGDIYDRALDAVIQLARAEERAAIVVWLRTGAARHPVLDVETEVVKKVADALAFTLEMHEESQS